MRRIGLVVVLIASVFATAGGHPANKIPRVGMLLIASREQTAQFVKPFEESMKALGYVQGRDIIYEHRFADGKRDLLPDLVASLLRLKLAVIVTGSNVQTEVRTGRGRVTCLLSVRRDISR